MIINKTKFDYDFSVVTACYNVELYIEEAIKSILKQTIGFKEHIQLILVDDGSTDNTGKILDKYMKKYPENILAIHKENGGVSSARNTGINYVQGKYVNFLDADDKFSFDTFKIVYDFFEKHYEETNIVAIPMIYFDAKKGEHYLNDKFIDGDRVIDLNKETKMLLKNVNSAFFKYEVVNNIYFDTELTIGEDTKFCCEILFKKLTLGVCSNAKYFYRIRSQGTISAMQNSDNDYNYYLPAINGLLQWVKEASIKKSGKYNAYFKNLVLNEIHWRLQKSKCDKPDCLSDDEWAKYVESLLSLPQYIENKHIMYHNKLFIDHKVFLLYLKNKRMPELIEENCDIALAYNGKKFHRVSYWHSSIEFVQINNKVLHLEGYLRFIGLSDSEPIEIDVSTGTRRLSCITFDRNNENRMRFGYPIYRDVGFKIDIPLRNYRMDFSIECVIRGIIIKRQNISFGNYSSIGEKYESGYYFSDDFVVWYSNGGIHTLPCGKKGHLLHEVAFLKELFQKKEYKSCFARLYFMVHNFVYVFFNKRKKKEYWLVFDRVNKGDDNGEAFFEFLQKNKKKEVKSEFLIKKDSPDYKRIKKIGKVTPILGIKHKFHYLYCDKVVSSNGDERTIRPIGYSKAFRDICATKKYVFLQHGVTKDDFSGWLNKYNKNIYKLVTVTVPEYNSFLQPQYYYDKSNIILTGFARYDRLYNDSKKYIAIMPTWRQYLNGYNNNGVWTARDDFEETDYFIFYNSLINDSRLLQVAKENGYKIVFLPHPNIYQVYIQLFNHNSEVEFLPMNTQYRKIFAESDLLLTDFSSVAFDFAYLRKPVIYSQFDYDKVFNNKHIYKKGYFDYVENGFGEVCYDLQSTIDTLIDYIKNNCMLKDIYRQRIEDTFPFNDKNNCQRIFKEIYNKEEKD